MRRIQINLAVVLCIFAVNGAFAQDSDTGMEAADIRTLIANESDLTEYAALIEQSGLIDQLGGLDSSTIFIPTNDAIAEYKNQTGDSLSDPAAIEKFILSNVVSEAIAPDMFPASGVMTNLAGSYLTLSSDGETKVNSSSIEYLGSVADEQAADEGVSKNYVYVLKEYSAAVTS